MSGPLSRQLPLTTTPAEALVIHCADPRFQAAFHRYVIETLGLGNYVRLVLGGGVHSLAKEHLALPASDSLLGQIDFMVTQFKLARIILFGHADCRWYQLHNERYPGQDPAIKTRTDLSEVAQLLIKRYGNVRVRSFWAAIEGGQAVVTEVV